MTSSTRAITRRVVRPLGALVAASVALVAAYIANGPHLDRFGDSPTYEYVADALPQSFFSTSRLPGYPILIALSSWLPGGRETGLLAAQAVLIVATVVATFFIARLALGHDWMAFVVALVIALDVLLAGYVRVVMSETLATFLASALFLAVLAYLKDFRPAYAWVAAALTIALMLTRPEWAFLPVVLVPYVLVIAWRRGRLERPVVLTAIGSGATVLAAVLAYAAGNLVRNGYFGLSAYTNVALLGKVMVYGMVGEVTGRYATYAPTVEASNSAWQLVLSPPFNDRNQALAGEFARSAIFHHPLRFAQDVMGSAITSLGEHDSQFLRIDPTAPFGHWLQLLATLDQARYRAFVIAPALALAWALAAIVVRRADFRMQALGALGLIFVYDWLITAAGTFGEFERLRMPTNPIATIVVLGTFLFTLRLASRDRSRLIPAALLICIEAAMIATLPRITSTLVAELAILVLAAIHAWVFVRWSKPLFSGPAAAQAGV